MITATGSPMPQDVVPIAPLRPIISKTSLSTLIWIELVACIFMVILRTWVQYRSSKRLFSNDYLIFAALACHLGATVTCELAIPNMYAIEELKLVVKTKQQPTPEMVISAEAFLTYQFALLLLLWTTLWAVKFSLLIFFWRLFESVRTKVRAFWWIMLVITASTFIITLFMQLFACGTPQNFFKLSMSCCCIWKTIADVETGGCATKRRLYLSNLVFLFSAGADITGDVLIVLIPFPLLWKLRTSEQQKMILICIFLLPVIPIVFGILRLVFCNPVTDVVDVIRFQLYSLLENTAAIITACLPSLRLFVTSSRNNSKVNSPAYYAAQSGKRSMKSHHQADPIALGIRTCVHDVPFDARTFSRIESEEEAEIDTPSRPLRGLLSTKANEVITTHR